MSQNFYHPIADLHDRLQRKTQRGEGMQISAAEMDWFVVTGGYESLMKAVVKKAVREAARRLIASGQDLSFLDLDLGEEAEGKPAREMPEMFSVRTLAAWWGVSTSAVYDAIKSGSLRHFKLGDKLYRIPRAAVAEFEQVGTPAR